MIPHTALIILLCVMSLHLVTMGDLGANVTREQRQLGLGLISIINFPNTECTDVEGVTGECYTATECSSRGGVSTSTCGNGIGVCCYIIMVSETHEYPVTSDNVSYYFRFPGTQIRL